MAHSASRRDMRLSALDMRFAFEVRLAVREGEASRRESRSCVKRE